MEEKQYYYIDWTMDWADEGDVCGFEIVDEEERNSRIAWLKDHPDITVEIYWGTNEFIEISSEDLLEFLSWATPITKEECIAITSVVGWGFGYCNWYESFVDQYLMNLEDDEE